MNHLYSWLVVTALTLCSLAPAAQAQNWRPFRPGLIYALSHTTANATYTLRLDSTYRSGTDTVYTFNRILRRAPAFVTAYRPSRNNLFGARLVCTATRGEYVLETQAEPGTAGRSLLLRPRAAVGSTWNASPTITATLTARIHRSVAPGVMDSVVTITLSDGKTMELSKNYGMMRAPAVLPSITSSSAVDVVANSLPVRYQESIYSPLAVFNLQPGDELGYIDEDFFSALGCYTDYELRRILTRQLTADSLIFTYQSQTRQTRIGGLNSPCGSSGPFDILRPVQVRRLALPLNRPQWVETGTDRQYAKLALLTHEYGRLPNRSMMMGQVLQQSAGVCSGVTGGTQVGYLRLGYDFGQNYYWQIPDMHVLHVFAGAIGESQAFNWLLAYARQRLPNGTLRTCGSPSRFSTLLSNHTAQSAVQFQLYPNPASHEVTLQLPAAASTDVRVTVFDMTGRRLRTSMLRGGQKHFPISLKGLAAGLYMVQLQGPDGRQTALRLEHRP